MINFLQIKPNSNNELNSIIIETSRKLLNSNNLTYWNNDVKDIIDELDDVIKIHINDDPISFINQYFKKINNIDVQQQYDIIPFNISNTLDRYHIMLVNNIINVPSYIQKLSVQEQKNNFNLLASSLLKFHSNSIAVFGDVFIIGISKEYYDKLIKDVKIENVDINNIYFSFKHFDLIEIFANIYFVKIYAKPINTIIFYSRDILNSYIKDHKHKNIITNIIELQHNDMKLYIKICDALPESHNCIMTLVNKQEENEQYNNFYIINLSHDDIENINKNY